ncbi:MAG: hypothetical protein EXR71_16955 [Myxococcales bacterium]|nr:hypothetical protein [Myxococcales bacterium]
MGQDPGAPDARARFGAIVAPGLILAAPFLAFTSHNQYPVTSPALWLAGLGVVVPGLVLGALGSLGHRRGTAVAVGLSVALAADLHLRLSTPGEKLQVALVCFGLVVAAAAVLRERFVPIISAFFGLLVLTIPLAPGGRPLMLESAAAEAPGPRSDLPPVVHLILDEQGGVAGIPAELGQAARLRTALREDYVADDFKVYTHAYSRYYDSYNSIPNVLNLSSPAREFAHLRDTGDEERRILDDNAYFEAMLAKGYRIRVYQSSYMDFSLARAAPVDYALTYEIHSIGILADLPASPLQKAELVLNSYTQSSWAVDRLRDGYAKLRPAAAKVGIALPAVPRIPGGVGVPAAATLKRLTADLSQGNRRGTLYFAHITLPHYTYLLDENCKPWPSLADWMDRRAHKGAVENNTAERLARYDKYLSQSLCTQALVGELVDVLKASPDWQDAVVLIHGDHGSRVTRHAPTGRNLTKLTPQDHRDSFSTFLAIKSPLVPAGVSEVPVAIQDALSLVLDGKEPEPAQAEVYIRMGKGRLDRVPFRGFE